LQIVEEVLEMSSSITSTFLSKLGVASSCRKNVVSTALIPIKLVEQEQQSVEAAERYTHDMEARMQAHDFFFFEELTRNRDEILAAMKKD
jgi:hypothetical protein